MGSLPGHLVDGALLFTYGVWWLLLSVCHHVRGKYNLKSEDESLKYKSYIPFLGAPTWPIESVLKILFPILGIFVEVFFTDDGNGHVKAHVWHMYNEKHQFNKLVKLHHITMYCCFIVSGIADILSMCIRFPKHTQQIFFVLAFFVQFVVFYFHISIDESRESIDVLAHTFLLFSIVACAVFALLRIWLAKKILINMGLAVSLTLQGTWFVQTGAVLKWSGTMNENMFLVACFVWHMMSIIVAYFLIYVLLQLCLQCYINRKRQRSSSDFEAQTLLAKDDRELVIVDPDVLNT